jgi:hypothetical protein
MNDQDFPYLSDGNDEERQGVGDLPLREDYELAALRNEVARQAYGSVPPDTGSFLVDRFDGGVIDQLS